MKPISVVMRTIDRAPKAKNYLFQTLANLERAGFFSSAIPHKLTIVTDTLGSAEFNQGLAEWKEKHSTIEWVTREERLTPNQNAALALESALWWMGGQDGWVMFLEDDVDFIADFLESVYAWLKRHADPQRKLYPLCAAYSGVNNKDKESWQYPIKDFYGTQAYVLSTENATSALEFMRATPKWRGQDKGHDMLLKKWAKETWPKIEHFLTPAPSFVQHLGEESSLHLGRFHKYESWPGREWSYYRKVTGNSPFTIEEQKDRKFSPALAEALTDLLPKDEPVHDLGCGTGEYVRALTASGYKAIGYEGTPGIKEKAVGRILHMDLTTLSNPLDYHTVPGSVICLEVAEHIPAEHLTRFLSTVNAFCNRYLVLSWAVKGQGGKRHVNEQNWDYVVPLIKRMGFSYDRSTALRLREIGGKELAWFGQSIYVFKREGTEAGGNA